MIRSRRAALAVAAAVALAPMIAGCSAGNGAQTAKPYSPADGTNISSGGIKVLNAFVLGPALDATPATLPAGGNAGLFLTLVNTNGTADRLTGVQVVSGDVRSVTMLGTGTTSTGTVSSIDLPTNLPVALTGPAPRLLLVGLARPLLGGESLVVRLEFAAAAPVTLNVPVMPQAQYYATYSPAPTLLPTPTPSPHKTARKAKPATARPTP